VVLRAGRPIRSRLSFSVTDGEIVEKDTSSDHDVAAHDRPNACQACLPVLVEDGDELQRERILVASSIRTHPLGRELVLASDG
jgi:hypothetical protein